VKAGPLLDLASRRLDPTDRDAMKPLTVELMASITDLVVDLRDRYPESWADDG
jgi:hypothetical protein